MLWKCIAYYKRIDMRNSNSNRMRYTHAHPLIYTYIHTYSFTPTHSTLSHSHTLTHTRLGRPQFDDRLRSARRLRIVILWRLNSTDCAHWYPAKTQHHQGKERGLPERLWVLVVKPTRASQKYATIFWPHSLVVRATQTPLRRARSVWLTDCALKWKI